MARRSDRGDGDTAGEAEGELEPRTPITGASVSLFDWRQNPAQWVQLSTLLQGVRFETDSKSTLCLVNSAGANYGSQAKRPCLSCVKTPAGPHRWGLFLCPAAEQVSKYVERLGPNVHRRPGRHCG
jgi:hypothetical protein